MLWFSYQGRFLDVLQLNLKLFILLVGDAIYKIQCRSHYRAHTCREAITNWLIIKKAHSASDNIFAIIATLKRQSKRANIDSTHSDIINSRIHCVKCPYSEFFWSVFSRIQTEHGPEKLRIQKPFTQYFEDVTKGHRWWSHK